MIINLTDENFESMTSSSELTVVDFNATWCGPCKMLAPVLKQVADDNADCKFFSADVDVCQQSAMKYRVELVPTIMLMKNGKAIETVVGYKSYAELSEIVSRNK